MTVQLATVTALIAELKASWPDARRPGGDDGGDPWSVPHYLMPCLAMPDLRCMPNRR
jgi:hypothetical protein